MERILFVQIYKKTNDLKKNVWLDLCLLIFLMLIHVIRHIV